MPVTKHLFTRSVYDRTEQRFGFRVSLVITPLALELMMKLSSEARSSSAWRGLNVRSFKLKAKARLHCSRSVFNGGTLVLNSERLLTLQIDGVVSPTTSLATLSPVYDSRLAPRLAFLLCGGEL